MIDWKTGDVVTAEKLNAMQYEVVELLMDSDSGNYYINAKAGDIASVLASGRPVYVMLNIQSGAQETHVFGTIGVTIKDVSGYTFTVLMPSGNSSSPWSQQEYVAGTDNDYPTTPTT